MNRYSIRRFIFFKLAISGIISVLFIITVVWVTTYATTDPGRIADAEKTADKYDSNIVLIEAPGLRRDIPPDLAPVISNKLYFQEEDIDLLNNVEGVNQIYPLTGTGGDSKLAQYQPYIVFDKTVLGENSSLVYSPIQQELLPSQFYTVNRLELQAGRYPRDNSNEIAISGNTKGVELKDQVMLKGHKYKVVGLLKSKQPTVYFPFSDGNYQSMYYKDTVESIEMFDNTKVNEKGVIYGNLLIEFNQPPTEKQLDEVAKITGKSRVYYKGYENFQTTKLEYIKMSIRKNDYLITFSCLTALVLYLIYSLIAWQERVKMQFFQIEKNFIRRIELIERIELIIFVEIMSLAVFVSVYLTDGLLIIVYQLLVTILVIMCLTISRILFTLLEKLWS